MNDPISVTHQTISQTLDCVRQFYIDVQKGLLSILISLFSFSFSFSFSFFISYPLPPRSEEWKFDTLCDLYEVTYIAQTVVFCNSARKVEYLTEKLKEKEFPACYIHSQMENEKRSEVYETFRTGASRILVTTDLLARRTLFFFSSFSIILNN